MNAENFTECLKNPSKLYQINYQEIKSLALQYPYCQNLQWLLLYKSGLDHHRDFDTNLEKAAGSSLDRTLLFRQMQEVLNQEKPTEALRLDEVLELQDLSKLRLQPEPIVRQETPVQAPATKEVPIEAVTKTVPPKSTEPEEWVFPAKTETPTASPLETNENAEKEFPQATEVELSSEPAPNLVEENENTAFERSPEPEISESPDLQKFDAPSPISKPGPTAKTNFAGWSSYQAPELKIKTLVPSAKRTERKDSKEKEVQKIAAQSIAEKEGVASETLAIILARQGQTEKAIKMYERLILLFPEKNTYFAAQILKLKRP